MALTDIFKINYTFIINLNNFKNKSSEHKHVCNCIGITVLFSIVRRDKTEYHFRMIKTII